MSLVRAALLLTAAVAVAASDAAAAPPGAPKAETPTLVHASASCAPATKPGRVRCRAVVELPLDSAGKRRLSFVELRVVRADPGVVPLRGRLGPLDAEVLEDARATFTFSVTTDKVGDASMTVRITAVVEPTSKAGDAGPTPTSLDLPVPVRVLPP